MIQGEVSSNGIGIPGASCRQRKFGGLRQHINLPRTYACMFTSLFSCLIHQFNSNRFVSVPHIRTWQDRPWISPRVVRGANIGHQIIGGVFLCVSARVHMKSYSPPSDTSPCAAALFHKSSPLPSLQLLSCHPCHFRFSSPQPLQSIRYFINALLLRLTASLPNY